VKLVVYIIAQVLGTLFGLYLSYLILMPETLKKDPKMFPQRWIQFLCPTGLTSDGEVIEGCDPNLDRNQSVALLQLITTMCFALIYVFLSHDVMAPSKSEVHAAFMIVGTAIGMDLMASNVGMVCLNPLFTIAYKCIA